MPETGCVFACTDNAESVPCVEAACALENTVGPERNAVIANGPSEGDAGRNERVTDATTFERWFEVKKAQTGQEIAFIREENEYKNAAAKETQLQKDARAAGL